MSQKGIFEYVLAFSENHERVVSNAKEKLTKVLATSFNIPLPFMRTHSFFFGTDKEHCFSFKIKVFGRRRKK